MTVYLYGLVGAPFPRRDLPAGVGDPPRAVALLKEREIAAVISELPDEETPGLQVRGLRRDMAAHAEVLNQLFHCATVLPVQFGVAFPNRRRVVEELLGPEYDRIQELLARVAGCVELTLKASYEEEEILREIARERPELTRRRRAGAARLSSDARLEQGRRIAEAIREKGEEDAERFLEELSPLAKETHVADAAQEIFFNAAFLVERGRMEAFDDAVESLDAENRGRVRLNYVGPLPPYTFSRLTLMEA